MTDRVTLKLKAREVLTAQRGTAIVLLLMPLALSVISAALGAVPFFGWVVSVACAIVAIPLGVAVVGGYTRMYRGENVNAGDVIADVQTNFLRRLGGQVWMGLFIFLWMLLLYVPGIIKGYSYAMTPYILANCPNVEAKQALKLSMRMMWGHKWELFVLNLSFIGWILLSGLTLHILGVVFVFPYLSITNAGYFSELMRHSVETGVVSAGELGLAAEPERLQ
jgi:uncharacterized membrane protein